MSQDLWPPEFGNVKEKTPVAILREQGQALGERMKNIVVGRVETRAAGEKEQKLQHLFYVYCAPLSFRTLLLYVIHDIGLYPVEIFVTDEERPPLHAKDAEEFAARLKEIFAREKTKKLVASLYAQGNE
jgi:hypothetical protein